MTLSAKSKGSIDINKYIKNENSYQDSSSSVSASKPKNKNIDIKKDLITLKFLNPSWVQLRNLDNEIVFTRLMNTSDEYSYYIKEKLFLTTSNAGNIIVEINGEIRGKIGKLGEIKDSFFIDNKFSN